MGDPRPSCYVAIKDAECDHHHDPPTGRPGSPASHFTAAKGRPCSAHEQAQLSKADRSATKLKVAAVWVIVLALCVLMSLVTIALTFRIQLNERVGGFVAAGVLAFFFEGVVLESLIAWYKLRKG